jgi:hypothetical protein
VLCPWWQASQPAIQGAHTPSGSSRDKGARSRDINRRGAEAEKQRQREAERGRESRERRAGLRGGRADQVVDIADVVVGHLAHAR